MIFVVSATLWVVPLYLAVTFLGYVINQLVATLLISTLSKLTTHYLHLHYTIYTQYLFRWPALASTSSTSAATWSTRTTPLPATATSLTCETISIQYLHIIYTTYIIYTGTTAW